MPATVPPAVAKSFSALIPGAAVIAIAGCVYWLFAWTGWGNIHDVINIILDILIYLPFIAALNKRQLI